MIDFEALVREVANLWSHARTVRASEDLVRSASLPGPFVRYVLERWGPGPQGWPPPPPAGGTRYQGGIGLNFVGLPQSWGVGSPLGPSPSPGRPPVPPSPPAGEGLRPASAPAGPPAPGKVRFPFPLDPDQERMAGLVAERASALGLDPLGAVAIAFVESSLRPDAVGDAGKSVGLFQAHTTLGLGVGHDPERLKDPSYHLDLVLPVLARAYQQAQGTDEERVRAAYLAINPGAAKLDQGPLSQVLDLYRALRAGESAPSPDQVVTVRTLGQAPGTALKTFYSWLPEHYGGDTRARDLWVGAACSAASMAAVLTALGRPTNLIQAIALLGEDLSPQYGLLNSRGVGVSIAEAMSRVGVPARAVNLGRDTALLARLVEQGVPVILQANGNQAVSGGMYNGGHWYVISQVRDGKFLVNDSGGRFDGQWFTPDQVRFYWSGYAVVPEEAYARLHT